MNIIVNEPEYGKVESELLSEILDSFPIPKHSSANPKRNEEMLRMRFGFPPKYPETICISDYWLSCGEATELDENGRYVPMSYTKIGHQFDVIGGRVKQVIDTLIYDKIIKHPLGKLLKFKDKYYDRTTKIQNSRIL